MSENFDAGRGSAKRAPAVGKARPGAGAAAGKARPGVAAAAGAGNGKARRGVGAGVGASTGSFSQPQQSLYPGVEIIRSAEPAFEPVQRALFETTAKERLQAFARSGQAIGRQVVPMVSRGFWDHAGSRGFEKIARGYAAFLAPPSERENLEWWIVEENTHLHKIFYLNQWQSQTAIADLSAAAIWNFPRLGNLPRAVQRVALREGHQSRSINQVTRRAKVRPEVIDLGGVLVTSIEQTIIDLTCTVSPESGLLAADYALHNNLTDKERLEAVAKAQGARRGIRNFWAIFRVVDGRVESPGESLMRWRFCSGSFKIPEPQVRIRNGKSERRPDGFDADSGTIYELDGKGKYGRHQVGLVQAFHDERERDAELEALGFRVLHMTWDDVQDDTRFAAWCRRFKVYPTVARRESGRGKAENRKVG